MARWRRAWEDTDYLHRLDRVITRPQLSRLAETLPAVDHVVVIPSDPRAASALGIGASCRDGVPIAWQRAVREVAAVLVAGRTTLGLERQNG